MKINKILAAGIAATLAVTSLAAVAVPVSAESKTFDMAKTEGTETVTYRVAYFTDNTTIKAEGDPAVFNAADGLFTLNTKTGWKVVGGQAKITGTRNKATNTVTETYDFAKAADGKYTLALKTGIVNKVGEVNINAYDAVTGVEIWVTVEAKRYDESKVTYGLWRGNTTADADGFVDLTYEGDVNKSAAYSKADGTIKENPTNLEKIYYYLGISHADSGDGAWKASTVATKDRLAFLEKTTDSTTIDRSAVKLLSEANDYLAGSLYTGGAQSETDPSATQSFNDGREGTAPFWFGGLASWVADFFNKQNNGKITFNFTDKASSSSGWKNGGIPSTEVGLKGKVATTTMGLFVNYKQSTGSLQSIGTSEGTSIVFDISEILQDMGGLTKGNVSDIYYGMNQGIEYKNDDYKSIHASTAAGAKDWLKVAALAQQDDPDVRGGVLWYASDAGTDATEANVGADATYWSLGHAIGYIVESVTLSYDEAAAAADADVDDEDDTDVTDDADDEEEDDVAADDADDDEEDDADDAELTDDTDDADDVANDEDINTPADDDANPGTGVALAVIPALVAGAAVVVSKKRK